MYYLRHHSFHLLLKCVHPPGVINNVEGVCIQPALQETFSFLSDLQGFKHFITVLSERNALSDRQWRVRFIFTLMFINLNSPIQVVLCTCMSQLGYAFLLERIHWRRLWYRSQHYFKHDILLCIHSLLCPWKIDFSSTFTIILSSKMIVSERYFNTCAVNSIYFRHSTHFNMY